MKVKYYRNIFLDSEVNQIGTTSQIVKANFPSSVFSIRNGERMRMILTSFEARRNWYAINETNNTFYWFDPAGAGTYFPIVIAKGNYEYFDGAPAGFTDLKTALSTAVNAVAQLAGSTVSYDQRTRKFSIDTTGGAAPAVGGYFVCFQVKLNEPDAPANVSEEGYFNDSNEVLGAIPTRDDWTVPRNAFGTTTGAAVHITPYVASLNTLEAIYIRTNLHSGNYQTYGFERDLPNEKGLTPTNILARIPLTRAYFDKQFEFVSFEDPNSLFSMELTQTQLSQVSFTITDDKGRLIPQVADGQAKDGNLNFKMTLRWEVVDMETDLDAYKTLLQNLQPKYNSLAMNGKPLGGA
jgi:hypothetical protein